MSAYVVPGKQTTVSTGYKTAAALYATGGALTRGFVYELVLGVLGVPNATDCPIQWDLIRQTAPGTTTAFTPNPTDPDMAAARATAGIDATVEGTITANSALFFHGMNQRNSVRWFAVNEQDMLVFPATANAGFALRALSPNYAGAVSGLVKHEE